MFDVALGAYRDATVAAGRVSRLGAALPGIVLMSVPVEVDGVLYHRVLAGPAADSAAAAALAGRIAEATGLSPSGWVIRTTPCAFLLGEMARRAAADQRAGELKAMDVPAYVLAVDYTDGSTRYRVYAGAFADENEASSLSAQLEKRGLDGATLSDRIGRLPE
jgi:cell division septation protein DedD